MTDPHLPNPRKSAADVTSSEIVTTVFERILNDIQDGTLLPGELVRDGEMAEHLGVSRTPVREALQRLREIGVIEASRGVFTRIADVSPEQAAQASVVWKVLFAALFEEVVGHASPEAVAAMTDDNRRFLAAREILDMQALAMAHLDFFGRLVPESNNPTLQRAITSVAHMVRLGTINSPEWFDFAGLGRVHAVMLEALRSRDPDAIRTAVSEFAAIEIPRARVEAP